MRTLTIREFAAIKRIAQNVNPLVVKKNKIYAKMKELNKEYNDLLVEIAGHEAGVQAKTGGMFSEELVTKRVEDTGKLDANGKPIKITKYEPKEGVVVFNEETNVYEIRVEEPKMEEPKVEDTSIADVDDTETVPEVKTDDWMNE